VTANKRGCRLSQNQEFGEVRQPLIDLYQHGGDRMEKACLAIGTGAGIVGSMGKKFAQEGYHATLCRRSDEDGLRASTEFAWLNHEVAG